MRFDLFRGEHSSRVDIGERLERELMAAVLFGNPLSYGLTDDPAPAPVDAVGGFIELCREVGRQFRGDDAIIFHRWSFLMLGGRLERAGHAGKSYPANPAAAAEAVFNQLYTRST